ncbi:MAG: AAA family ATPase [Alphaproteobacteria bacterium]|nr:AAA family ATPase [Alphaproteobacteria bacterium]
MPSIEQWLREQDLASLVPIFLAQRIDFEMLADLTESDLRELGLAIGERKRLMRALRQHRSEPGAGRLDAIVSVLERRPMTVLFCDIVGSSALTARLEPEDMIEALRKYREVVCAAIARYQGFVARFVGDGILAYFGYPVAHENDAERAVRAALAISADIGTVLLPDHRPITVRVGIATGMVVVGDLFSSGGPDRDTVVGTTPNLAAALQNLAPANGIIIAPTTLRLVQGFFRIEALGPTPVKGLPAPIEVSRVVGELPPSTRFRAVRGAGVRSPFVGRTHELARLGELWSAAVDGHGQVVVVVADPGMGKSRLLEEFAAITEGTCVRHTVLAASPLGTTTPLGPLISNLELVADGDDDSLPAKRLRLDAIAAGDSAMRQRAVAAFASVLSLPEDAATSELSPDERKRFVFDCLIEQFDAMTALGPVLITLEDLHWLDPTSLALLERIRARVPERRAMLVVTSRRRPEPDWLNDGAETIVLGPLAREASRTLLDAVAGPRGLTPEQAAAVLLRSGGVPLFVEEFVRSLTEPEIEGRAGGTSDLLGRQIPATLHESLMARLDEAGAARRVAQVAAVIGQPLTARMIEHVSGLDAEATRSAIDILLDAEVLEARDERLSFRHALLRDAAYEGLLRDQRRDLHRRTAAALSALMPEYVATQPAALAHHLAEAAAVPEAVRQLTHAARHALRQSALPEAAEHLQRGIALAATTPEDATLLEARLEMMGLLGPTLFALRGPGSREVEELYAGAFALCQQLQEARSHFPIYWGWWRIARDFHVKQQRADELLRRAQRRRDPELLLQAHHCSWASAFSAGALCDCGTHIDRGLAIYDQGDFRDHAVLYGNHDAKACGHGERAFLLWHQGVPARAWSELRRALAWARRLDHLGTHFHLMDMELILGFYCREEAQVLAKAARLIQLAEERGFADHRARGLIFRGWAQALAGELRGGRESIETGLAHQHDIGTYEDMPLYYAMLAEVLLRVGEPDAAADQLARARTMLDSKGVAIWMPELLRWSGLLQRAARPDDVDGALAMFTEARALAERQGSPALALRARIEAARALQAVGDAPGAHAWLEPVAAEARDVDGNPDHAAADAVLRAVRRSSGGVT